LIRRHDSDGLHDLCDDPLHATDRGLMSMERSPEAPNLAATAMRPATSRGVLDPVSRASEILFGLIMVLTFTLSLAASAGPADVRAVLIGVLGCNLAWAIIDAVMYLMGVRGERRLAISAIQGIRDAESPAAGQAIVADNLPSIVLPALNDSDLERIRVHLAGLPVESLRTSFSCDDYLAAIGVFLLVFLCLFPVAAPLLFIDNIAIASRLSNAGAVCMLFLTGFTFGRQVERPYRTGFLMVAIGITLVMVAMALGG
jgi:hypothetical protein